MWRIDKYLFRRLIIYPPWLFSGVFISALNSCGFESLCCHLDFRFCVCFEEWVSLHSDNYRVCKIIAYSWMHHTDKYSKHSSIIWPVWLNGWALVYQLSGSGFESSCSHLNFRFRACFKQGVPWHLGNYWVWIHSETRTWHDKKIQTFIFVCQLNYVYLICCFIVCIYYIIFSL